MPTYSYRCKCGNEFDVLCKIAEMDDPKPCSACGGTTNERFLSAAPSMGDSVRLGIRRPDAGFREVLSRIHEKTPGSTLNQNANF